MYPVCAGMFRFQLPHSALWTARRRHVVGICLYAQLFPTCHNVKVTRPATAVDLCRLLGVFAPEEICGKDGWYALL